MGLISQSVRHLLGGVNQRPALHRAAEQVAAAENALLDIRYGAMKRPRVTFQQDLTATTTNWSTAFIHPIERDANEKQRLVIVGGSLKVYDVLTGAELTVRDRTGGFGYLSGASDASDFRARSIGDSTFIVNRTKTPAMNTTQGKTTVRLNEALVYVRRGEYSTPYAIYLDGRPFVYITPDPATAVSEGEITTDEIARQLKKTIDNDFIAAMLFTVTRFKSTLYIRRSFQLFPPYADFTISATDGLAGEGLKAVKHEVQSVDDLPRYAKQGMVLKIVNSPDTDKDDFYVKYRNDNTPSDGGVWVETAGPGLLTRFDRSTLPHQLLRQGSLFPRTANEHYPYLEPDVTIHEDDTDVDLGFDEDEGGNTITDDDVIVRDDGTGVGKDLGGDGTETEVRVAYDVDTSLVDPGADIDVVFYHFDGVSTETELLRKSYTPGKTALQEEAVITTSTFNTGHKLRVKLEYQQDTAPTTPATQATITFGKLGEPYTFPEDPLDDEQEDRPKRRWKPPIKKRKIRSVKVSYRTLDYFGTALSYPTGTVATVKVGADSFSYTVAAGEGATEIATSLATSINADPDWVATNPAAGVIKIQTAAGTSYPTVVTNTRLPATIFYNSDLSFVTNEFAGKTLVNVSDGSEGTITSNTTNTVTVTTMSGGTDNAIYEGDVCYVKEAGTYFVFDEIPYEHREAGDDVTNAAPSFIGEPINDVFFYENRLGFVAGEHIIMSESADLFNFWRTAVSQLLDSDRIDVQSASASVGVIHSVVEWNSKLYGFAENVQFEISGHPAVGPRTLRLDTVSKYFCTDRIRPIVGGQRLFFMHNKQGYVQVQAYAPPSDDSPDLPVARDITRDVPSYIQGKILDAVGDASLGLLAVLADGNQQNIYVYSFAQERAELVHEAWQRWSVPAGCTVLAMEFSEGNLALVIERADGIYYADMDLDIVVTPGASERVAYIDLMVTEADTSPSYSGGVGTTWTLPYAVNVDQSTEGEVVVWRRDTYAQVTVTRPSTTTVRTSTDVDLSAVGVNIGLKYTMTLTLTPIYKRDPEGQAERTGRMQLRSLDVNYLDTTDFTISHTLPGSRTYSRSLSAASPRDGTLSHSIMGRAEDATITLTQSTAGGARFASLDWEAYEHRRHRRA